MSEIVIGALLLTVIIQQVIHHCERKDLYNRIMSRDLDEYKGTGKPTSGKSAHAKVLDNWRRREW